MYDRTVIMPRWLKIIAIAGPTFWAVLIVGSLLFQHFWGDNPDVPFVISLGTLLLVNIWPFLLLVFLVIYPLSLFLLSYQFGDAE